MEIQRLVFTGNGIHRSKKLKRKFHFEINLIDITYSGNKQSKKPPPPNIKQFLSTPAGLCPGWENTIKYFEQRNKKCLSATQPSYVYSIGVEGGSECYDVMWPQIFI